MDFAAVGYVDLQAGWRVRVVTPVTKSGSFNVVANPEKGSGGSSMKASEDFLGYEVSYYAIEPRRGGGVSVHFRSATITKRGKNTREPRPIVELFQLPGDARFVRLLFITRVSPADHDQGIVAAASLDDLQELTSRVQADPEHNCTPRSDGFCSWVPNGIAVQPEKKQGRGWVPAT